MNAKKNSRAALALTVLLYLLIPKGLFPTQDTGQLQARIEAMQSVSFARMAELQQTAAKAIHEAQAVATLSSIVGVDAANNTMLHTGSMLINLKPDRSGSQQQIMERLRERVRQVAGVTLYLQPTQDLTIDAETGPTQFRLALEGSDTDLTNTWATRLVQHLQGVPQVQNEPSDSTTQGLAAMVSI